MDDWHYMLRFAMETAAHTTLNPSAHRPATTVAQALHDALARSTSEVAFVDEGSADEKPKTNRGIPPLCPVDGYKTSVCGFDSSGWLLDFNNPLIRPNNWPFSEDLLLMVHVGRAKNLVNPQSEAPCGQPVLKIRLDEEVRGQYRVDPTFDNPAHD